MTRPWDSVKRWCPTMLSGRCFVKLTRSWIICLKRPRPTARSGNRRRRRNEQAGFGRLFFCPIEFKVNLKMKPRDNHRMLGVSWARRMRCTSVCALWLLGSVAPKPALAEAIAEGGSPLYSFAVHESIQGLKSSGQEKNPAAGQVCPQCGKVHPAAPPNGTNQVAAISGPQPFKQDQPCPICGQIHAPAQILGHTNLVASAPSSPGPSGETADKYYYCAQCKVYHQKKLSLPAISLPTDQGLLACHQSSDYPSAGPGSLISHRQANAASATRNCTGLLPFLPSRFNQCWQGGAAAAPLRSAAAESPRAESRLAAFSTRRNSLG